MDLVEKTAADRFEWAVHGAGRPAGIGAGREILAAMALGIIADREVSLDQVDLLPILVDKRLCREHPRRKAQQAGAAPVPPPLVEGAGQDLLLDAGRIARWGRPTGTHVEAVEFEMGLVDGHGVHPLFA